MSNGYRFYPDHKIVTERKFQRILTALNVKNTVNVKSLGCEGVQCWSTILELIIERE
jgi:hypothetical protein